MTITVAAVVRDEITCLANLVEATAALDADMVALDTGSSDGTPAALREAGATVEEAEWHGMADARTRLLALTHDRPGWTLMIDADMTIRHHPDLRTWLDGDPDPDVTAWQVEIEEPGLRWRLPLLTRNGVDWRYEGATHSYLVGGTKLRSLLGLTVTHHGRYSRAKIEADIEALRPGVEEGDPRSVYYTAQTLRALGHIDEAIAMYDRRAEMGGWEEEAWHAQYMAARLRGSVPALLAAHSRRPHRPEPLAAAAALLRSRPHSDVLFVETPTSASATLDADG